MKVIGVGHTSRVGKDLFADFLERALKRRKIACKRVPFASVLKSVANKMFGWAGLKDGDYYETSAGEKERDVVLSELGKTPVEIWVELGQLMRSHFHKDVWVRCAASLWRGVVIITDVRFPNEVEAIKQVGGVVVHIIRPGYKPRDTDADNALIGFDGWDAVVHNDGTENDLRKSANEWAHWIDKGGDMPGSKP